MERISERLQETRKAHKTLSEALDQESLSNLERDGAIQRFEYTFESVWKMARVYLLEYEGITANSPKTCFRSLGEMNILSEEETIEALKMADDRNLTVHMYIEEVAIQIFSHLKSYASLIEKIIRRIEKAIN